MDNGVNQTAIMENIKTDAAMKMLRLFIVLLSTEKQTALTYYYADFTTEPVLLQAVLMK